MKDPLSNWIARLAGEPEVQAAAVLRPDRSCVTSADEEGRQNEALAQALKCLADTFDVAGVHRMAPEQMRWIYEQSLVYCMRRSDGALLGLFLKHGNPSAPEPGWMNRVTREFNSSTDI